MAAGGEGTAFGKYFLLKKIATGGMGEIFLAKLKGPVGFEKLLVIKRILQHHVENPEFVDMFFAEARIAAQLNHSNIVQIYEMGEIEDSYFIAMEYVHGKSLRDMLDRARTLGEYIPPAHAVDIIGKLCSGMGYAHNARDMSGDPLQIVHRDINPHNLLISYAGEVKVIDFGIAKSEISSHKTETGTIKGKFVYMSPEQSAAEPLDKRSDVFSVGICLYESLTFVNPFAKANVVLSLDAIQRGSIPPVAEYNPRLAVFQPIVDRALAKSRHDRYDDCGQMRSDLMDLIESGEIPKAHQSLAQFMHDLFEEQIEEEKRMILDTDSSNTETLNRMRRAHEDDLHSGSDRISGSHRPSGRVAAHSAAMDVLAEGHSRGPFVLLLFVILALSGVASVAVINAVAEGSFSGAQLPGLPTPGGAESATPAPPTASNDETGEETEDESDEVEEDTGSGDEKGRRGRGRHRGRAGSGRAGKTSLSTPKKARTTRPPDPPTPPPSPTHGSLQLSSSPPVRITRGGSPTGQTIPKLKSTTGTLVFGAGSDPEKDPFEAKVRYKIEGEKIFYAVEATPWAIVRKGNVGIGKTPIGYQQGDTRTVFELLNPKEGLRLRITLRYSPP